MENLESTTDSKTYKEVLTAKEAMKLLGGISRNTFNRMRNDGTIKVYKLRRQLYCKYSEIMEALEANLIEPG